MYFENFGPIHALLNTVQSFIGPTVYRNWLSKHVLRHIVKHLSLEIPTLGLQLHDIKLIYVHSISSILKYSRNCAPNCLGPKTSFVLTFSTDFYRQKSSK